MRLAIAGATGNIGRELIRLLEEMPDLHLTGLPVLLASGVSEGEVIPLGQEEITVQPLKDFTFNNIDVVVFATPSEVSKQYIPQALEKNVKVIDFSGAYRSDEGVPVIVPEVNGDLLNDQINHVSVADASVVCLATLLQPLMEKYVLKRVESTGMYPTSYAGKEPMDELFRQSAGLLGGAGVEMEGEAFEQQIAFNVIPQVGAFTGAHTEAETALLLELNRVLKTPVVALSTAVYVPTFIGMSQTVTLDFEGVAKADDVRELLNKIPYVSVIDDPEKGVFSTPYGTAETGHVFVSRIRENVLAPQTLQLWVTCDNLRAGAALQAVKILERWA